MQLFERNPLPWLRLRPSDLNRQFMQGEEDARTSATPHDSYALKVNTITMNGRDKTDIIHRGIFTGRGVKIRFLDYNFKLQLQSPGQ